ncbi:Fpg/Nei family DNA glycosylase [Streptomyces silvisoli]|uniref:DNA-formamidopyrimidine glycosylase family protein n=1 Tax=Streptomyces silvisoli TaxID=3034235 RepID=A0ABT5ZE95_9ACTN|nr:DNA-formamidopyrimidine glycosylase family protein [Streptomyces silvisoli]MDF3288148.1 DNA-formamidopyrimidine glycosylase family protein [Streptomyces silvisoli]
MPELPDVEGFRRVLAAHGQGRRIADVKVADPGVLHGVSARGLRRELVGRRLGAPERHGKWLIARTDAPVLLFHFGMTGALVPCTPDDPPHPHDRVVFVLDGGELRFRDQRKLQGIRLADEAEAKRLLATQGPDALTVGRDEFEQLLSPRRGRIKAALLDQSLIAGLGNLLADEILWRARIHPACLASKLDGAQLRGLYTQMRHVLRASVRVGRVPGRPSWLTGERYEEDPHCPRCGHPLCRGRIAGRGTVWCPQCQPERC